MASETSEEKKAENKEDNKEGQTLEETFAELEEIIRQMEEEELSLEDSFTKYHEGMDLLKSCNDKIDRVEKQMQVIDEEGNTHDFTE